MRTYIKYLHSWNHSSLLNAAQLLGSVLDCELLVGAIRCCHWNQVSATAIIAKTTICSIRVNWEYVVIEVLLAWI